MRIIPKTAKVKVEFFRNISVADIIIALVGILIEVGLFLTNIGIAKYFIMVIILCIVVGLYFPFDGQRFYMFFVNFIKFMFSIKKYSREFKNSSSNISQFLPYKGIKDNYIEYDKYYAGVLQIDPREFRLLSGYRQDQIINNNFGRVIRSISNKTRASLVKIDRKMRFDEYVKYENIKKDALLKVFEQGELTEQELFARERIIDDRIQVYNNMSNGVPKLVRPFYYLVVYDEDKAVISEILNNAKSDFLDAGMTSKILDTREIAIFLKYNYSEDFEEQDAYVLSEEELMDWVLPQEIRFTTRSTFVDGVETFNYTVKNYPLAVPNAWGYQLFSIEGTKVVMNIEPYEKSKAVKMIDRSLQELMSQSEQSYRASSIIDKSTHINTLVDVMRMLQNDNESLYKVTLHIVMTNKEGAGENKKDLKKRIKRIFSEQGFDLVENFSRQQKAVIGINLSMREPIEDCVRSIHSSSIAACFPFVQSSVMDPKGVILGQSGGFPTIINFFMRNDERVNSNMVIMGKSGSGKSYATKTLLTHLAAENCKTFILDPENEYNVLSAKLGGKLIDVGTATQGRINPFHVITTLEGDEAGDTGSVNNFSVHLQFLEQFFREILPGIDAHALEYLNNLIIELYKTKGINAHTDFSKLTAKDYPIFDDLEELVDAKLKEATVDYDIENLRVLHNFVAKFAHDGRDANLWNGESSLSVKENFCVFNFQSLLANKNGVIANAQMLLVLKWLDNEIIKNRDFNLKHNTNRRIIVAIDEAHVFIDPKYPIALDFMYQLAKRIRKYNGMQIIITQNIKDFVGSQDIIRKSTAIINACQYSLIFALAPNDMDDLCTLYDKAGRINTTEQDQIVNNPRGNAFIITSPSSRNNIEIVASQRVRELFSE